METLRTQRPSQLPKNESAFWFEARNCLFCGGADLYPWRSGVRDGLRHVQGSWSFKRCGRCRSAHLSPMPKQEKIPDLYPSVYTFRPDIATPSKLRQFLALLEDRVFYRLRDRDDVETIVRMTGTRNGRVLDVGCGTGERLVRLAKAGFQVKGMEIQQSHVEYVRKHLGFEVDLGTLDTLSYPPSCFDIVTIYSVIEHVLDVSSLLKTIRAMLKPNGWIIGSVPLCDSFQSRALGNRWFQFCDAPRHIAIPTQAGLRIVLGDAGFNNIAIYPSGIMNCAGGFAISVLPQATTAQTYRSSRIGASLLRVCAGVITMAYLPVAALENHLFHVPAFGLFAGQNVG